jgi:hypothetical protein
LSSGIAVNLLLAHWAPAIVWLWWNPIGVATTMGTAMVISRAGVKLAMPAAGFREAAWLGAAWLIMIALLAGASLVQ